MPILLIIAVAVGGALGRLVRFAIVQRLNAEFFWGTLCVNVIGAALIGCLFALVRNASTPLSAETQGLLIFGFCGGLTTFSAFSLESLKLIQDQKILIALSHAAVHVLGSFAAVSCTYYLTQKILDWVR